MYCNERWVAYAILFRSTFSYYRDSCQRMEFYCLLLGRRLINLLIDTDPRLPRLGGKSCGWSEHNPSYHPFTS